MKALAAKRSRGFTLIEVMVAMSILTLVLLGTVTGMRTLGNTQVALERVTHRVDEVRTVSGFLRGLMESAVVGGKGGLTLGGGSREATYFRVGDGFLEWKTNLLFGEAYGGTHVVRISQESEQLMLRWLEPSDTNLGDSIWTEAPSRPLVTNLELLGVAVKKDFTSDWVENWDQSTVAPALVRLQLKSDGRFWPDLIMQVQR